MAELGNWDWEGFHPLATARGLLTSERKFAMIGISDDDNTLGFNFHAEPGETQWLFITPSTL